MDSLWNKYRNTDERLAAQFEEEQTDIVPRTRAEEVHAWEDWACRELKVI